MMKEISRLEFWMTTIRQCPYTENNSSDHLIVSIILGSCQCSFDRGVIGQNNPHDV